MRRIVCPCSQASKPSSATKRHIDCPGERGPYIASAGGRDCSIPALLSCPRPGHRRPSPGVQQPSAGTEGRPWGLHWWWQDGKAGCVCTGCTGPVLPCLCSVHASCMQDPIGIHRDGGTVGITTPLQDPFGHGWGEVGSRAQPGAAPQPHSGPCGGVGPSTTSSFLTALLAAGTSGGNGMGKAALGQRDAFVSIINFPSSEDGALKRTRLRPCSQPPPSGLSLPPPHNAGGTLRSSHGQMGTRGSGSVSP